MKIIKVNTFAGSIFFVAAILLSTVLLPSCARKISFATSAVVPAAEGSVKITKDKNKNYSIDLFVMRLASPKRLTPAKELYIVWMNTDNAEAKNIGQLKTSSSMMSSALKSSLRTVASSKPTAFFITAEDVADIQHPSGQEVLRTVAF